MDLQERLTQLENVRDWQGLVEELEKAIPSANTNEAKASFHLRLGHVLEQKFLAHVKALKHFQDAYKLHPALGESLEAARTVYWSLGKVNMVQKLFELELRNAKDESRVTRLLTELGGVLCDLGDYDKATSTYARALTTSGGKGVEARACLEDVQADSGSWQTHVRELVDMADATARTPARSHFLLRAARITRRFAPDNVVAVLEHAYTVDPLHLQVAALYEGAISEQGKFEELEALQLRLIGEQSDAKVRARFAHVFGVRWVSRHQNADTGLKFLEMSLRLDPENVAAFYFLRDAYGRKGGDWDRVLTLAEDVVEQSGEKESASFLLGQVGTIAWRQLGNLLRARAVFSRLGKIDPTHPLLRAFEAQIGESLSARPASSVAESATLHETPLSPAMAAQPVHEEPPPSSAPASEPATVRLSEQAASAKHEVLASVQHQEPPASTLAAHHAADGDASQLEELRALADKQEANKRYNEYVKTLLKLAAIVPDDAEKIAFYTKAAELYSGKFANQAEAVKAYEAVLAIDPENRTAIDYLRHMYEKRRDWEKLLGLERKEAERLEGDERASKLLEIARLASERVKKPEVCIELWVRVLDGDPLNGEALGALGGLYERSKEYDKLVRVLEQQVDVTSDAAPKIQILTKLGTIYGDRLNNDEGAVNAWRELLLLDPQDRKAQEALKKKYLALGRWDDLEVFYAETGKWDEFIRVLEQQEAKETAADAKIGLLFKIAELWSSKKQKNDRAARAYEKVLELDPSSLRAAEALIPIYSHAGNAKALANAIEVKLGHEEEDHAKIALLREVAALYEGKVKEPEKAFARYLSAFALLPSDERSTVDVERAAKATGGWPEVETAYRTAIDQAVDAGDVSLAITLRLKLGRVLVEEMQRVDQALDVYRAVYDRDSDNVDALAALERLYRATERYTDLLGIYEKRRDLSQDREEKQRISYEIAKLYETEVKDLDRAIDTYSGVLEDEPTDGRALAALDVLYRQLERWEPYVDTLRRRIELDTTEQDLIDLKFRLGQTLEQHIGDAASALDNYREILLLDAQHDGAREALEAMLGNEQLRGQAAAILENIYEERGDSVKLLTALDILSESEDDSDKRVALLRKIARVSSEMLNDHARAFKALASALREQPQNAHARAEIEHIAEISTTWKSLTVLFEQIAESVTDADLARSYWMRSAQIGDQELGLVDEAASGYVRVLSLDPADGEALDALEALFVRTQRWMDLIGVVERRIEQTADPAKREALYVQMARIYDGELGRPDDAVTSYKRVLDLDPSSHTALEALDALFTRQRRWSDLAENLEAQLALATDAGTQLSLMLRLASLRETEMGQIEQAIDGYRSVLERDVTNTQALTALERLGREPNYELVIADLLEPLYRQIGDYQKLIFVHEVQVRRADDVSRRVDLLHQIAGLYEDAAADLDSAFATHARALKEDPASEVTQQQIDRVARATGRFGDLAKVYRQLGEEIQDVDLASSLFMVSGRVYEADIGDVNTAISLYRRVLETEPAHLAAAEALERLFRHTERYEDLSLILQRKAEILSDPADRKNALFQAAAIEEDVLDRPEAAIFVYKKVLEIDEDDVRALDALSKRYLGLSRWQDLLAVYSKKADLVADPEEKKRIYDQVGGVYERELGDIPLAIDTYQKILELDPDDRKALERLDILYEHAQNWQELLEILTRESEMCEDPNESIGFQYRIAELYEKRLDDVPRAIELYRDILQRQVDHEPTLRALEGLKSGDRDPLGASAVLEPVYEAANDWVRLISVHEVQVHHAADAFSQVDLLHRIARLYEDALEDHHAAFDTYARALSLDNGNQATLQNLERLAMVVDRWPAVAALYDAELDKLTELPERFVELALRTAQIFETQLDDVDNAILRYRRVIGVEPENQAAVRSLDRLYMQTERWADLAAILEREAEIGQSADEILELKYRLGEVERHRLSNLDGAIAAYRDVLSAAPDHAHTLAALEGLFASGTKQVEIAEILEPLYRASGEWEKLAGVYEAQLAHTNGQEERLQAYYRIADLYEERLVDPVQTLAVYVRALQEFPLDEKSGEEAPRLAGTIDGGWETLANAYADIVGLHEDTNIQCTTGRRLAKTFEDELGDIDKAIETYRYVLAVEPLDLESLANLDRIYLSIEAWEDLAGILEMRVQAETTDVDLVDLYARLGEVYEAHLGDIPRATVAYRKIFDGLDKTHDGAVQALARIYSGQGAWVDLNAVYERELENASGDVAEAEIRARIANLASERLNDPARAIETWKIVLDLRGEDPEALAALSNLYESQEAWRDLVDILEREFDIAQSDDDRVNILTRRARTFASRLHRDEFALEDWNRVLDIDYANLPALRAIADIRRRQNDSQELVSALHQMVDRASSLLDTEELKEIFRELGKVYGESLSQPFDAADAWRKLLEVGADFEAMNALEAIYRGQEQWPDVIDVKMQRAAALEDPAAKIEEYRQVAELWRETVQEPDSATAAWQSVLEISSAHDEAFAELEKLHTAASRWEPLVELYLVRLETRTETAERTDLLRRIARVFEEKLDDKNQAFDALITAFGEDFHDRETTRYLERMAQATGRWGEVVQTVQGWLEQQTDPQQKIRLCLHLAKWYGDDLAHLGSSYSELAKTYYAQILALDPNNVGAARQMGQLYRKNGNWQQLGAMLTHALNVAVTDVDRKEIQTELGELLDSQMAQTDQAITYFQRALEIDPQFIPAIENLERIYAARGQNKELVDILTRKVPALTDSAEVANTKLRIAALYEQASDAQRAAQTYREVIEIEATNLQGLRGLSRSYEALEQWQDLVGVLETELDVVTTEGDRIGILMQLAGLEEEQFRKPDVAAARLEQVLEIDPNHEEAYFALERCYRKLRQWNELINVYERHVLATQDRKTKIDLYGAIAQVYAEEINDPDRAIDAYKNIVDLDEANLPALDALSRLYDRLDDASQSIDYMTRVAELTQDEKQRVEAFYKIGKALDEKLGDRIAAQERYEMALDLDPSHTATLGALRQIALDNSDYDKAARYIDQEQSYTTAPRQRARLLVELGRLREDMLADHESAVLAWEAAYEADPENEEAALPLVDEYIAHSSWERAEVLLDMLTRKANRRDRGEQHALWNKLGLVSASLHKDDKAYKAYGAAHQLDLTDQTTIRGLAEVCFRLGEWGAALTNFQKVLTSLGEDESQERAEVYFKLGAIKREQGQVKQAINNFEKALGVDGAHVPTLHALVGIYSDLKDWKQVVAYKRQMLDSMVEGDERFALLVDIGEVWNEQDKNPARAIEALEEARDLKPNDRPLLHKLLSLYETVRAWDKVVEIIEAISVMERDPLRKYKFIYAMAQIYRDPDKLNNQEHAVELFNEALDLNPTGLEAFERINKILTAQKDWKALERAFRKMLRRLSTANVENKDLEFNLWHNLGLIYRDRLSEVNSAIEAFKMATRYKPDEPVERRILAELYESTDQLDAAIGEHLIVLQKDPLRVDPYRSLYKIATKMHDYDRAWCMCSALAFLQKADEEERRFFEDYRPRGMLQVRSRLDNEQWIRNLFHKDENIFIGKIFEMITSAAITAKTQALAKARQLPVLDRRFKQDPATSTVTFAKTFGWAAQVLGIQLPDLYVRNDTSGALVAVPSQPAATIAGQNVLTGYTPQELTFIVGKHLSYYRGEHYIKNLFPTLGELKVVFYSAIKIIDPAFSVPPEMEQAVMMTAEELKKYMQPVDRDGLRLVVQKFIEDGAKANLKRWMQTVDITAARAGLLLCADLEIARKIIADEPQLPGDLSPPDKLKELIVFSVSDQYLALRKALGIAIG